VVIKYTEIWGGKDIKKTVAFFYPIMPKHINIIANNTGMETTKMPIK